MKERVILHCDANSFFASVEIANNPQYEGKPVAVAGNPEKRTGIILTKNHIAKKYGIETGEVIWKAKSKCPNLICLSPHYRLYEEYSKKLKNIYERYTDRVESFGIDECWLDVTDSLKFFGNEKQLADRIRNDVKNELNITISVGVSFCKLFAKLGSDLKKPDATTIISKENFKNIIYPLPINAIIGIGRRLEVKYNKIGVSRLGDIINIPDNILKKKFGKLGIELKEKLLGIDNDEVKLCDCFVPPKSIGNGTTTITDIYSRKEIIGTVSMLSNEISTRLRYQNFNASGVSVTLKTATFQYFHQTNKFDFATNSQSHIINTVMNTIDSFWQYNIPIRAIRICVYNLSNAKQTQQCMFSNIIKDTSLNLAIDKIRSKYGYHSISPAISINNNYIDIDRLKA